MSFKLIQIKIKTSIRVFAWFTFWKKGGMNCALGKWLFCDMMVDLDLWWSKCTNRKGYKGPKNYFLTTLIWTTSSEMVLPQCRASIWFFSWPPFFNLYNIWNKTTFWFLGLKIIIILKFWKIYNFHKRWFWSCHWFEFFICS